MPQTQWRQLRGLEAIPTIADKMAALLADQSMARAQIISDQFLTVVRNGNLKKLLAAVVMDPTDAKKSRMAAAVAVHEPDTRSATLMFAATLDAKDADATEKNTSHLAPTADLAPAADAAERADLIDELRNALSEEMKTNGVSFVQWATDPVTIDSDGEPALPQTLGYSFLGTLQYLALSLESNSEGDDSSGSTASFSPVIWTDSANSFGQLVSDTYEDSMDCPAFTEFRTADDLLHSYRTSPHFCEQGWHWVDAGEKRAGVLILSKHNADSDTPVAELTYMGVVPEMRGRSLGQAILAESIRWARHQGCGRLILAVDVVNDPARRLYEDRGFSPILRETVWGQRVENR